MSKTSPSLKAHDTCDACGKSITKAHRVHNGEAYCDICYPVWFKKKPCTRCGEIHRAYITDPKPVCSDCIRKEPCIRCGKDAFINGSTTHYGRVCQSCKLNYFSEEKQCFECGEVKKRVLSYSTVGHSYPICINCYGKRFRAICPCCHKHRKLVETENGKKCKKCHDFGKIPCPKCQNLMWAGMGKQCHTCYLQQKLDKKVDTTKHLFNSEKIKQNYEDFNVWFGKNKGLHKANIKFTNFLDFFARCDKLWGEIPSYDLLVAEFKPEGLRHNLTVLRWLIATKQVTINEALKEQMAEEERITNLFAKLGEKTPDIVKGYYDYLLARQQQRGTALKTVRLSLQPVVDIYHQFALKNAQTPSQKQLNGYLAAKSGQKNSLSSFVVFLREKHGIELSVKQPTSKEILTIKKKDAERGLMELAKLPKPLSHENYLKWLQFGMVYFHGVTTSLKILASSNITENEQLGMQSIKYNGSDYFIPKHKSNGW